MEIDTIHNCDCIELMQTSMIVDCILTSPPYNMTNRKGGYADKSKRYDSYDDWKTPEEYIKWSVDIFQLFNKVLAENGTILYNFSYSIENPGLPYQMVSSIINETDFTVADTIIWKKNNKR